MTPDFTTIACDKRGNEAASIEVQIKLFFCDNFVCKLAWISTYFDVFVTSTKADVLDHGASSTVHEKTDAARLLLG